MNYARWNEETDVGKLTLKLAEETGEVCKAITSPNFEHALIELDHVRFIADRLREVLSGT